MALVIYAQFGLELPSLVAAIFSLLTDLLGLFLLIGTLFFLLRPRGAASPRMPIGSLFPALLLLFIAVSGFLTEGVRLAVAATRFTWTSPLGWLVAQFLPNSPILMQTMMRLHFLAVLIFVASAPYTFMRHLVAAAMNVFYTPPDRMRGALRAANVEDDKPGAECLDDFTWKQLLEAEACVSCGRCQENCPAYISGKPLSPRKIMQDLWRQERISAKAGKTHLRLIESISENELWACTTCQACVEQCPVLIDPMDKIMAMRRFQTMGAGALPSEARPLIRDVELYGDSSGKGPAHREDWTLGYKVSRIYEKENHGRVLLWLGCAGSFHPRYQQVGRSMVKILQKAEVPFAIAGKKELCCGDPIRRLGDERLFQSLARRNLEMLESNGVKTVVVLCPHCFNTLKNEYPAFGGNFDVVSAVEYIAGLIGEGRVIPQYSVDGVLAIHDPCYLGRVNQIYDCLRQVAAALPGVKIKELEQSRQNAFCCGGGGGRMWLHESEGVGINKLRAQQVLDAGVDVVATACPYCMTMIEDGLKGVDAQHPPRNVELIELVAETL